MWFGLLGPLVIRVENTELRISASRLRVLLAALLLTPGQPVPSERLAELVWDGVPPPQASVTLRSYVKRLRQVLGAAAPRIVTADHGYLVEVAGDEVDLARYTALCRAGDDALRSCAWPQVAELLGEAEGLWRGPPLADIPCRELQTTEVPRLEQLRVQALGWRIEAELSLGRARKLVPELYALTAKYPLQEPFHHQLMLALYRSGRAADALAAYREARHILVTEIGAEPGAELRLLHQRILAADREMPARPGLDRAVPALLPSDVPHFVGRAAELRELTSLPQPASAPAGGTNVAVVSGTAGVGKTALAVHWAHQVTEAFPDGQIYLNMNGFGPSGAPVTPLDAVSRVLDAMQVPGPRIPPSLDGRIGLYRTLLAGRRVLIVLDNARDEDQVRPLLPGGAGCVVVITSRSPLTGLVALEGARALTLDVLTISEARVMVAGRLRSRSAQADPAVIDRLIEMCARLPLALAIATALIATRAGQSISVAATSLASDDGPRLDVLSTGETASNLRAVLSWSYHALSPAAAEMFRLLAEHPGPAISSAAAASLAGVPPGQARAALAELAGSHLVSEPNPGRFVYHDLLRLYAAEQLGAAERHAAGTRLLDHYARTTWAAAYALNPLRKPPALGPPVAGVQPESITGEDQALRWLRTEHQVLMRVISYAANAGFDTLAWQLPGALTDFLDRDGHWHDWAASQRTALAASRRAGDITAQALAHRHLARACSQLQDLGAAKEQLDHALELQRRFGTPAGEASVHMDISCLHEQCGDYPAGLRSAELALTLYRSVQHQIGEATALNQVGWHYAMHDQYAATLLYCEQALELCVQLGYELGEGLTWDSLGFAHQHLGQPAQAAMCFARALEIFRKLGHRHNEAKILIHLGDVSYAAGDLPAARRTWLAALTILDELSHPDGDELRSKIVAAGRSLSPSRYGGTGAVAVPNPSSLFD